MKGYKPPEAFSEGICFICGYACDEGRYAHRDCAVAYGEHKEMRIKKARMEARE